MAELTRITIYPIKALDGLDVAEATILPGGSLAGDREFALFDEQGKFVNGKRNAKVHQVRSRVNLTERTIQIQQQDTTTLQTFHLDRDRAALTAWLSQHFGFPLQLRQNLHTGFPDDTASPGPTAISLGTYETIATWFPDLGLESIRLRFRANLEISGVPPFWEDRLFTATDEGVSFQIGSVQLVGINPCQRCIVPARDPLTGEAMPQFQKQFISKRKQTLPSWVAVERFNHFYRLSINTRILESEAGKQLRVGDRVVVKESEVMSNE